LSRFTVYVLPDAWSEIKDLPGHMRQRVRRAVDGLASDPRPSRSTKLDAADAEGELRRLRLDRWRIVYLLDEGCNAVDILAVRKRPPYDYGDLERLLAQMD
jgi:mRNA interferase RelE/StbE